MTITQISQPAPPRTATAPPIRLGLASARGSGPVDGAWWPRGRDTATEVRALVGDLDVRLPGHVTRINIQRDGWDDIPRKLTTGAHEIRVGWFRSGDPHLVTITTSAGTVTQLLLIPPKTAPAVAAIAMAIATSSTNAGRPTAILEAARRDPDRDESRLNAEQAWDNEGGPSAGHRPDKETI